MKGGTPNFVGARLREAREVRSLTQLALSELLDVSAQAISQYETGQSSPHPWVMEKLPTLLHVQPAFFVTPRPQETDTPLFFRSMSRTTLAARTRAKHKYHWLKDLVDCLSEYVELPRVNLPPCPFPDDPLQISMREVEQAAADLRRYWGLGTGAISNMTYLLENQGVMVTRIALGADTLDAFSNWRQEQQRPYVILGTEKAAAARTRLNAAHELGHMVLHRNIQQDLMRNSQTFKLMEDQAFRFAGAFLLPMESFAASFRVPTLDGLTSLKLQWNVSIAAMLIRARELKLVSADEERRLWRNYARRGYRQREPLDDQVAPEQPAVLEQSVRLLVEQQVQSREQIRAALPLAPAEIEALAGLPTGYLSDTPQVHLLQPQSESPPPASPPSEGGKVIHLPAR